MTALLASVLVVIACGGGFGWFVRHRSREARALIVECRRQWHAQQGEIAEHFNDYLPLTDDLVREWFAAHADRKPPRDWKMLLLEHDAGLA